MQSTPRSNRLHIAFLGRRNAGKSSLINALANQEVSLGSPVPGTTTDPVFRAMELLPLGPVVLIDTAGLDDEGALGELRVKRTRAILERTELAVLIIDATLGPGDFELGLRRELESRKIPVVGVVNKLDLVGQVPLEEWQARLGLPLLTVSAAHRRGIDVLKRRLVESAPADWEGRALVDGLVRPGDLVYLVTPIDLEAPKGRLILPQVQTLRDILDHEATALVLKENAVERALARGPRPDLVIIDSQVFGQISAVLPPDMPLVSFSILFARHKGDLGLLAQGARRVASLKPGDRVLVAEACTHHPVGEDIGRVKIPRWLEKAVGGSLEFEYAVGPNFPPDLSAYALVIHCGGCMLNRGNMLSRLERLSEEGVPVVNYGVLIAYLHGALERTLSSFSDEVLHLRENMSE
ncbi:MAG: [FeFe] hydrogenase H-cluster maturation GTPase HydF [Bacillota bacterium]